VGVIRSGQFASRCLVGRVQKKLIDLHGNEGNKKRVKGGGGGISQRGPKPMEWKGTDASNVGNGCKKKKTKGARKQVVKRVGFTHKSPSVHSVSP